ncbi:hypothetical protein HD806DRAFT_542123 [Xylariaceae sp. AK1471]|nr:hypothetical protein HD806DRAFT_542123 [Xylariaceae sp. AK1471]
MALRVASDWTVQSLGFEDGSWLDVPALVSRLFMLDDFRIQEQLGMTLSIIGAHVRRLGWAERIEMIDTERKGLEQNMSESEAGNSLRLGYMLRQCV